MKKTPFCYLLILLLIITITAKEADGQARLTKDLSYVMEVPSVMAMESSAAHLYVLSDQEGMALFRTRSDSLQWLYSSSGMERRGFKMTADIRFAYLFGDSRRLTVLEPTSVLGVYSSTQLPGQPLDAKRMNQFLYVALGQEGLGRLDLSTPASVDSAVTFVRQGNLQGRSVIDLEASLSQLFALTPGGNLFIFDRADEQIKLSKQLTLDENLDHIFVIGDLLLGSDRTGSIFEIDGNGNLAEIGTIREPVKKIELWQNWLIIKGESNRIWTSYRNRAPQLWKSDSNAGNYFTVSQDQFWLSEYDQITRISTAGTAATQGEGGEAPSSTEGELPALTLKSISNITVPTPKPVLLPIQIEGNFPMEKVQFAYQSNIQDAQIRGNGFYWHPQAGDVGTHQFKIIATSSDGQVDSTMFAVDVRSFNAPPRFSPIRQITIPVGEPFTLPINATDPDGTDRNLIRYIGVDLPEGATVNERTGRFTWTPTARQTGENTFQVVATDQYGAASQIDITIKVIEIKRSEG